DVLQLFVFNGSEMRKIKAQMIRRHQKPRLLHMLAQHLAQPGMEQVRCSVIALGGLPRLFVDDRIDVVSRNEDALSEATMCTYSLYRKIAAPHFSDYCLVIATV